MIKSRPFRKLMIMFTIIGVIGLGLMAIFGPDTVTYISKTHVAGITYYQYDFASYTRNLADALGDTSQLTLTMNPLEWMTEGDWLDWTPMLNNLAYIGNWFILVANIIIYPFRIGAYAMSVICAFLGLPVTTYASNNPLRWLYDVISFLKGLEIPMITMS